MDQAHLFALPVRRWEAESLEDTSLCHLVLEHYEREHASLRRYLSFLGLDSETSQEVMQESFLKLHEHLLKDGDCRNLRAWLYRVAHNLARNAQTSIHATRLDPLPDASLQADSSTTQASAEAELLAKERTVRLRQAMQQLSAAQRECLVLRAQGFKYREIADVLKLSVSTVGENIQRGLDRLRGLL